MLDAIAQARGAASFAVDEIEDVEITVPRLLVDEFDDRTPHSVVDAQYSAPFTAATLLLHPQPSSGWITDARLTDPAIVALMTRIRLVESAELSRAFAADGRVRTRVRIGVAGGASAEGRVEAIRGSATLPLTDAELEAKFEDAAEPVLPPDRRRSIIRLVDDLESLTDVDELVRLTIPED